MVLVPVPELLAPPGLAVRVHVPEDGSPFNTTLPVDSPQPGWVMSPTSGAEGVGGWVRMTTEPEAGETQPSLLVTVKVCVPVASAVMVVLVPTLFVVVPLGLTVTVQLPLAGSPLSTTLPVDTLQVG